MKIQTQLFAVALAGMSASCGTVSDSHNNSSSVAIATPDAGEAALLTTDGSVREGELILSSGVIASTTAAPAPIGEVALATL